MGEIAIIGADIHDGDVLRRGQVLVVSGGVVAGIVADVPAGMRQREVHGTILPGFVDLQVNGGGGVMFNDDQSVQCLQVMSQAHASSGTVALLPTLITDTAERTRAAISAVEAAIDQGVPGIIGLHLEGPHLSVARKGAHDPDLIREMSPDDMDVLLGAAGRLPNLMLTVAPETVSPVQIGALCEAGAIVSLGHSDAPYDQCMAAIEAGAICVTHLFNAMSQLGNREPGLVGAALDAGAVFAGLIADGIHVHPAAIRASLAAKRGPGQVFLVTDAMATAGSDIAEFTLNGRQIYRRNGRLTLQDGTLAGADLEMPGAVRVMVEQVGVSLEQAISMATRVPSDLLSQDYGLGRIAVGQPLTAVHLSADYKVTPLVAHLA